MTIVNPFTVGKEFNIQFNIGCLFDIPTGRYHLGERGEAILLGGLSAITGILGPGNTNKSTLIDFMNLRVLSRISQAFYSVYDTEGTKSMARLNQLAREMHTIGGQDLELLGKAAMTDLTEYFGEEWWEKWQEYCISRAKQPKDQMGTTPFVSKHGGLYKTLYPMLAFGDSMSAMPLKQVEEMLVENEAGSSDTNMEAMASQRIKNQMMITMPKMTSIGGLYLSLSGHLGTKVEMDKYKASPKALATFKANQQPKGIPPKFMFYTSNCWTIMDLEILINKGTGGVEFPRNSQDDLKKDTDLIRISVANARCKTGPTGYVFDVILSQRDGVHVGLTEFYYIRGQNRYGLGGNVQNYHLELMPDVNLSRTTIRSKYDTNPLLQRAMEITSEMCQLRNHGHDRFLLDEVCTPKELYEDLKAKGYDWNVLLDTRGYWVFKESEEDEKPFLSTMDLLRMKEGKYHPYWLEKPAKAN